ncbi:MAG: beta-glucosidase [Micromonosporaceae bacterium]|nr:beta-glucosidase [Micromonosporaceae bacterium]
MSSLPNRTVNQIVFQWETALATAYQKQVSTDRTMWTNVHSTTTGPGDTETLAVTGSGRNVRIYGTARNTTYGYSIRELQVFGR